MSRKLTLLVGLCFLALPVWASSSSVQTYNSVLDAFAAAGTCPADGAHAQVYNGTSLQCVSITGGGGSSVPVAACGYRANMAMAPLSANPTTQKLLVGPAAFVACAGTAWIGTAAVETSTDAVYINNVGDGGGYGTVLNHDTIDVTAHVGAGCSSPCVSTQTNVGGIDPGDPGGTSLHASLLYHIYLVARAPANSPNDWGLVASSNVCTNGPSSAVKSVYPYYTCIDWFYSNSSATAMQYMTVKNDHEWYFAGGTGTGGSGTAFMPMLTSGTAPQWTAVTMPPGMDDETGLFTFDIETAGSGTFAALAPNTHFDGYNPCKVAGGLPDPNIQCRFFPDQGTIGYYSTDALAHVFIEGGVSAY